MQSPERTIGGENNFEEPTGGLATEKKEVLVFRFSLAVLARVVSPRFAAVALAVTAGGLIACDRVDNSPDPTPTQALLDLSGNKVAVVSVDIKDRDGDSIFGIDDAYSEKGEGWRARYNVVDGDFEVNEDDVNAVRARKGTLPVLDRYDINNDGMVCDDDAFKVERHKGPVPRIERQGSGEILVPLDTLWEGIVLDKDGHVITFNRSRPNESYGVYECPDDEN